MKEEDFSKQSPLSDNQIERLLEWDEALAQGSTSPQGQPSSSASDARLAKQIRCMQLLRQSRRKLGSDSADGWLDNSGGQHDHKTPVFSRASQATPMNTELSAVASQVLPAALGKFELREEIGRGGYGVVFLAYDRAMGREVALKVPHATVLMRDDLLMRFRIESRAAALLDHPNIVQVFDAGSVGPVFYIASAYCPGTSLHDWLTEHPIKVAPREAAQLILCLARAIQHANERGVFHRDLKPANILLQPADGISELGIDKAPVGPANCESERNQPANCGEHAERRARAVELTRRCPLSNLTPRITDFGLAKLNDESLATVSGAVLGTPAYMAPEQASGQSKASTSRVDVYSLGAILYQILTGKVPFEGKTPWETLRRVINDPPDSVRSVRPEVNKDLETICLKCLEKDPELRYASAGQLAEDIQRFLNHEPILARNASVGELLLRIVRRKPLASTLAMALVVAILTGLITVFALWKQSESRRVRIELALNETAQANEIAKQQQATSKRLLYLNSISLADRESTVNLTRARELLMSCEPHLRDWEWDYLWKTCNPELLDLPGHKQAARVCRFSPDGERVASGSGSWGLPSPGEVIVRETRTGKVLWESRQHLGQITSLSFHPSGNLVASADHSWQKEKFGSAMVWEAESGNKITSLRLARNTFDVEFDPTGKFLATAGTDGKIRFFRTENWRLAKTVLHHTHSVQDISYHPSGDMLASGGRDGRMCVIDIRDGKLIYEQDDLADVRCVCFNADGSQLACSTFNGHILIWDTHNWKLMARHSSPNGRVGSLEYCPDGDSLLVSTINGPTQVWDVRSGQIRRTLPPHYPATYYATFSSDGTLIASCGADSRLKIWGSASSLEPTNHRIQDSFISELVVIPKTNCVAAGVARNTAGIGLGDGDYSIRIVDRSTGKRVRLLTGHNSWTTAIDVSSDGEQLVSASLDGSVKLWDLKTGSCLRTFGESKAPTIAVAFVSVEHLVTASQDGLVRLWNAKTGIVERELAANNSPIICMEAERLNGWIAAADETGNIRLWNWKYPDIKLSCDGHRNTPNCLSFSADGMQLAAGGSTFEIAFWDIPPVSVLLTQNDESRNLAIRKISHTPGREIRDMAFLPSGERLAYASTNFNRSSSLRLIDTVTGEEALRLMEREENASAILFDTQNQELLLAANSQLIHYNAGLPSTEQRWNQLASETSSWYVRQATQAERQQRAVALTFYLTQLIATEPSNAQYYSRRANAYAAQQKWDLAEGDFTRYAELSNNSLLAKFQLAMLDLARGNKAGFHTACDEMIDGWSQSQEADVANTIAWTLVLTPERLTDLDLMMERAEFAVNQTKNSTLRHQAHNTLGLVLYRAQQFDKAMQSVTKSIELKKGLADEADWAVLSMIHHALGNRERSSQWLRMAQDSFQNAVFLGNPTSKAHSRSWISRFQIKLLIDEAQQLHQETTVAQSGLAEVHVE